MTDFEYGRWYQDSTHTKIWRMESCIEAIGDYLVFAVSSFESWYGRTIPKNLAIINNDKPNIGVIRTQDGAVTIDADRPLLKEMIEDALVLAIVNDVKKSIDLYMKKEE